MKRFDSFYRLFFLILFFASGTIRPAQAQEDAVLYPRLGAKVFSGNASSPVGQVELACYDVVFCPTIMSVPPEGTSLGILTGFGDHQNTSYNFTVYDHGGIKQEAIYNVKQERPNTRFITYLTGPKKIELNHFSAPLSNPRRYFADNLSPKWFAYTRLEELAEPVSAVETDTVFRFDTAAAKRIYAGLKNKDLPPYWHPSNQNEWTYFCFKDNNHDAGRGYFEIMAIRRVDTLSGEVIVAQKWENGEPAGRTIFGTPQSYFMHARAGLLASNDLESQGTPNIIMNCYYNPDDPKYKTEMLADTTDWNSDWLGALSAFAKYAFMRAAYQGTYLVDGMMMDTDDEYWRAYTFHLANQLDNIGYQLDMNWDGLPDDVESEVNVWLPEMYHNLLYRIDTAAQALGRDVFVIRNGHIEQFGHTTGYVAGREFEDFGMVAQDDTYKDAVLQYLALADPANTTEPHLTLVAERDRNFAQVHLHNYRAHRHTMALTTVLGDGYYCHTGNHSTHIANWGNDTISTDGPEDWFDEYAVDSLTGKSVKLLPADTGLDTALNRYQHIGWLGHAWGPGYAIDSVILNNNDTAYTFRRDFDNGIVIYSQYPHTVPLEGSFLKINGADPDNDGSALSEVVFDEAYMGIFLLRSVPFPPVHTTEVQLPEIQLYPNPASDFIQITWNGEMEISQITVFDMLGRALSNQSQTQSDKSKNSIVLNLHHLPNGAYWLSIQTEEGRVVKKIMVQH